MNGESLSMTRAMACCNRRDQISRIQMNTPPLADLVQAEIPLARNAYRNAP